MYLGVSWSMPDVPVLPVRYLVERTMINNEIAALPSPCGTNCSYTAEFTGPYFQCQTNISNITTYEPFDAPANLSLSFSPNIYNASMRFPPYEPGQYGSVPSIQPLANASVEFAIATQRLNAIGVKWNSVNGATNGSRIYRLNITEHKLICRPFKIKRQVLTTYENSIMNLEVSTDAKTLSPLVDVLDWMIVPDTMQNGTVTHSLNASQIEFIQDGNLMTLILQMASRLSGSLDDDVVVKERGAPIGEDSEGFRYFPVIRDAMYTGYNGLTAGECSLAPYSFHVY